MKKLMWIVCLLVVSVTAQAQFEKGKWIVNPSVTGLGLSYRKISTHWVWVEDIISTNAAFISEAD